MAAWAADGPRKGFNPPQVVSRSAFYSSPLYADAGRFERTRSFPGNGGVMSDETHGSAPSALPDSPSLEWLRKEAKRRLAQLRAAAPDARLADAQFEIAKHYGFSSWRVLK